MLTRSVALGTFVIVLALMGAAAAGTDDSTEKRR
jgi:hypothetical protein